jgi:hypothetical protein
MNTYNKRKPTLEDLRKFYIYQLIRLTDATQEKLENLSTNELQELERAYYHDKYKSHGQPEYKPMIDA